MLRINIHEAKTHLSRCLEDVGKGETIIICNRNRPVAEIRPVPAHRKTPRPVGLAKGVFQVPDTFFDDLPGEEIALFDGEDA